MSSPNLIYRVCIWLPLLVPLVVIVIMNVLLVGFDIAKPSGAAGTVVEIVAYSGMYGGLPYLMLAVFASWWFKDRSEPAIRRAIVLFPIGIVLAFALACVLAGALTAFEGNGIRTVAEFASVVLPLGYTYVALTFALRQWLGSKEAETAS